MKNRPKFSTDLSLLFSATQAGARLRLALFLPLMVCFWLLVAWINQPTLVVAPGQNQLQAVLQSLLRTLFSLRVLIVVFLPFYLALEWAAQYQALIYDLPRTDVSRQFLLKTSLFLGHSSSLTINAEQLSTSQQQSPIALIGGPGKVNCAAEFAAVFERPNGSPRYVLPGTTVVLDGFERLRRIIDLRDHILRFDTLSGRSRDGVRITLQDVQVLFSVRRPRNNERLLQNPYSALPWGIYWLTYRQPPGHWTEAVRSLVATHLLTFMQRYPFGALFASIGEPEIRRQITLQSQITQRAWERPLKRPLRFIWEPNLPPPITPPTTLPRPDLSAFFYDFTQEFHRRSREHGIRIHWISVGTWDTPETIVLEQHVEAWKLTLENRTLNNEQVLHNWREQHRLQALAQYLREVPLQSYFYLSQSIHDPESQTFELLKLYLGIFREAASTYEPQAIPSGLQAAMEQIRTSLREHADQSGQVRFLG